MVGVMKVRIIRDLVEQLSNREVAQEFMNAVELRQRSFGELKKDVLILDQYDLIAHHILLYCSQDGHLVSYIRSVPEAVCRAYNLEFPMATLVKNHPEYEFGFQAFRAKAKQAVHMGYLCLEPSYRGELKGAKAIDLMVWLGFMESGLPPQDLAFTATINNRYKQDGCMKLLGDWVPDLPDLDHPVIPDKHRVVLVPQIREGYWEEQREKFAGLYTNLNDDSGNLLERKKAA
jgi:hypothetical protein